MYTIFDNKHNKMILCLALAAAMVLLSSACSAENSKGNNEAVDQSNISDITLDEDSPDKKFPVADETTENNQPDTVIGEQEINDAVAPKQESSLSTNQPTDTTDKPSPNTAPQPQENAVEDSPSTEPADDEIVRVLDYIPSIFVELKYATEDNFTGQVVYDFVDAQLRYGTVKKLAEVQTELLAQGYSLKIWDAYRPVDAQFKLWEICPDPVYVANPNTGYSSHSRGNTVDVTLVLTDGTEIKMPTGFDDFSTLADRNYSDIPADATENVLILENMMKDCGFNCYSGEWWHYSDSNTYPVMQN